MQEGPRVAAACVVAGKPCTLARCQEAQVQEGQRLT